MKEIENYEVPERTEIFLPENSNGSVGKTNGELVDINSNSEF